MADDSPAQRLDPSDPYLRAEQTFPSLSQEMAGRVASFGTEEALDDGALLFRRGERSVDFFLCMGGAIEIVDVDVEGAEHIVHVHEPRQFTGELDLFNDRSIL